MKTEGGSKSSAAGLAQDYLDVVDESERAEAAAVRDAISAALVKQMDSLILRGPLPIPEHHPLSVLEDGVALRRWLVERFPVTLNPTTNWVLSLGRWANSPTSGSLLTRAFWSAGSPPASVLPGTHQRWNEVSS